MRFHGTCIVTKDVDRLREFYEKVLQTSSRREGDFVELSTDGAALTLYSVDGMNKLAPGLMANRERGTFTIEFQVNDVDREYDRLRSLNVDIVKKPTTQPWGRRSVWMADPDGNIVNFYANVG